MFRTAFVASGVFLAACQSGEPQWTAADFGCDAAPTPDAEPALGEGEGLLVIAATLGDTDIDVTDCFRWRVGAEREQTEGDTSFATFESYAPDVSGRRYVVQAGEVLVRTRDGAPSFVDERVEVAEGVVLERRFTPAIGAVILSFNAPEGWTIDANAQMQLEGGGRSSGFQSPHDRAGRTLFLPQGAWRFEIEARGRDVVAGEGVVQSRDLAVVPGGVSELAFDFGG